MKTSVHFMLAAGLLAGGILVGRAVFPAPSFVAQVRESASPRPAPPSGKSQSPEDEALRKMALLGDKLDGGYDPDILRPGMERLSTAALEDMARSQMESWEADADAASYRREVAEAALDELCRREGTAVLERLALWPEGVARRNAETRVLVNCIHQDWASAMPFVEKYLTADAGTSAGEDVCYAALEGAAARNAGSFNQVLRIPWKVRVGDPFASFLSDYREPLEFAEDFDFLSVDQSVNKEAVDYIIGEWASRRPDEAWDALRDTFTSEDKLVEGHTRFAPLAEAVIVKMGEIRGMEWLGGKVAAMPRDDRARLFDFGLLSLGVSGEAYARFSSTLEPADRLAFIEGLNGLFGEILDPAMDTLTRPDLIQALAGQASLWSISRKDAASGNPNASRYARLQQRFSLTPDEMNRLKQSASRQWDW